MVSDKVDKSNSALEPDSVTTTGEGNQYVAGKESRSLSFSSSFKVDESNSGLGTHSSKNISEGNQKVPGKESRSSSSLSCSSSSNDPGLKKSDLSCIEEDVPATSMPNHDDNHCHDHGPITNHHDGSTAQLPPSPMTGQPADPKPSGSYRIPSSVFARTKSSAPEWSVASNESLFSIHMDNMSFARDSESWYAKSEEYQYDSPMSFQLMDMSSDIPPSAQTSNLKSIETSEITSADNGSPDVAEPKVNDIPPSVQKSNLTLTERAVITSADYGSPDVAEPKVNGVLMKDISDVKSKQSVHTPSFGEQRSDASMSSVTSFAFPILTNDNKQQSGVQPQNHVVAESKKSSQESPKQAISPKPAPAADQGKWSCFPCGRFCS